MRVLLFIVIACVAFASCRNCSERTTGYIIDRETLKAIDSVTVVSFGALDKSRKDERTVITDSAGYFETFFSSKSTVKCPVLKLEISKVGYQTVRFTNPRLGDTILLSRAEQ